MLCFNFIYARVRAKTYRVFPSFPLKRDPCPFCWLWMMPCLVLYRNSAMKFTNTIDVRVRWSRRARTGDERRAPGVRAGGRANGYRVVGRRHRHRGGRLPQSREIKQNLLSPWVARVANRCFVPADAVTGNLVPADFWNSAGAARW